jgi:hypothetical protein
MTTGAHPFPIEIGDLVARLAARAPELARDLLRAGVRRGPEWCVSAADSGPFGCSVSVHLIGSRAGVWKAWAADRSGDALDLIVAVADLSRYRHGTDRGGKAAAIRWALDWLRIDPAVREQPTVEPRTKVAAEQSDRAKRNAAFRWWLAGRPLAPGDEAFDYLVGTRGIDLTSFSRVPRVLRYIGALPNVEAGRRFPALIAGVFDRHGKFLSIHRIWLERQTDGRVLKAPVAEPKKVYSGFKGGLIPLWRGASGRPWKDPAPDDVLGLTEGVEDALTYASEVPEHRVAAAISIGNLLNLVLHPSLRDIIIAADNDQPGSPAAATLDRAVAHFAAESRQVRIARAPAGFKDLNDLMQRAS